MSNEIDARHYGRYATLFDQGYSHDEAFAKVMGNQPEGPLLITKSPKYGNTKTDMDGIIFDSKKEASRYRELKLMQNSGEIDNLELQPVYRFELNGVKIARYTPDFRYEDTRTGEVVVEDVKAASKAARSRDYVLRKKMLKAFFGIDVKET